MEKILIVDDEQGIVQLLSDYLAMQGYEIMTAGSGGEALAKVSRKPDLILLDINMPDLDGYEVCRAVREHLSCPIVFLSAKIEEQDKIRGLMAGGDDYLTKPFSIEELGARVMAHLRRESRREKNGTVKFCRDLAIRYDERTVFAGGNEIRLTRTEFDILELLSGNPGQVFGREQIYEHIRGLDGDGDSDIVMEHVRRIRTKIGTMSDAVYIETVWGVGYKWIG